MTIKNAIENNSKLFVARQDPNRVGRQPIDFNSRRQAWEAVFNELHIPCVFMGDAQNTGKNKQLCMVFPNGLRIEDNDTMGVSFWANEDRNKLDENMNSVIQIIRVAAKHLKSRGDQMVSKVFGGKYELSGDNFPGSKPYVDAFVAASTEKDPPLRTLNHQLNR